jgi:hypothetical protein
VIPDGALAANRVTVPDAGVVGLLDCDGKEANPAPAVPCTATDVGVIAPSENVIAGVVVAVATLPETPLAVTTETEVTVPPPAELTAVLTKFNQSAGITVVPSVNVIFVAKRTP